MRKQPRKLIILAAVILINFILLGVLGSIRQSKQADSMEVLAVSHDFSKTPFAISSHMKLGTHDVVFKAYYSEEKGHWCMVLPAMYGDTAFEVNVDTRSGERYTFPREDAKSEMTLSWEGVETTLEFLYAKNAEMLYVALDHGNTIDTVHSNKELELPGSVLAIEKNGKASYIPVEAFSGHGNDSWEAEKKSYDIKFPLTADLFGMGVNNDFVLLAGYRDNSLMSFCVTNEMVQEVGFEFAPEFRLVNLYVGGEYLGVYFLTERMEIDQNRIQITNAFDYTEMANGYQLLEDNEFGSWVSDNGVAKRYFYYLENNPQDITGGWLLEHDINNHEEVSRFASDRNNRLIFKRAKYASKEQVDYMADFWQEYEDALYSENGYNQYGKHYSQYIDLESFVKQWLIYEVVQEYSMHSSVYYYKESDIYGDGLLHACFPWDMEHSFIGLNEINRIWNVTEKDEYWSEYYRHEDFRNALGIVWRRDYVPALELMLKDSAVATDHGLGNIRWYEENLGDVFALETSRWSDVDPAEKCESIRTFLETRLTYLNTVF